MKPTTRNAENTYISKLLIHTTTLVHLSSESMQVWVQGGLRQDVYKPYKNL